MRLHPRRDEVAQRAFARNEEVFAATPELIRGAMLLGHFQRERLALAFANQRELVATPRRFVFCRTRGGH